MCFWRSQPYMTLDGKMNRQTAHIHTRHARMFAYCTARLGAWDAGRRRSKDALPLLSQDSAGPRCSYYLGRATLRLLSRQDCAAAIISAGPRCGYYLGRATLCGYCLGKGCAGALRLLSRRADRARVAHGVGRRQGK